MICGLQLQFQIDLSFHVLFCKSLRKSETTRSLLNLSKDFLVFGEMLVICKVVDQ